MSNIAHKVFNRYMVVLNAKRHGKLSRHILTVTARSNSSAFYQAVKTLKNGHFEAIQRYIVSKV